MEKLIKMTFSAAMECNERVYLHAMAHKRLIIGQRGLLGQESEKGIVLSFSSLSCNEMSLEETGISAKLRFSGKWEDVFVPYQSITAIFDNLHEPTFLFNFHNEEEITEMDEHENEHQTITDEKIIAKVVKPDFSKRKKN